ncbi:aminotransferase class I/II-fold pyridoxal phosphate-dependent enzyme [Paenibacillus alvei]|uniref:aminotransferase class I/II-fold pyridoxal phosphate-dependent enzyme n=1 Tax=Paenibacillus alvei TaxID=44250 RepID=UPI00042678F6|nr:aminotransferase class I/II-fold pyridoxal phosphate-dependent enzyme [Paenibacillus alvei]
MDSLHDPIISAYVYESHLSEIHQVQAEYVLSKSLLDPNLLPNLYFSEYVKQVFDLYPKMLGTYFTVQGDKELRDALCRYFTDCHRFHLSADELLITCGSQEAMDLVARGWSSREIPSCWSILPTARQLIFSEDKAQLSFRLRYTRYDLEQVEKLMQAYKPRLFYLNPTFQSPTGYIVPAEQRKRLVELAERYQCLLVEDDPYRDIYFGEEPPRPLFAYGRMGHLSSQLQQIISLQASASPSLRAALLS